MATFEEMEHEIEKIYRQDGYELHEKWKAFMTEMEIRVSDAYEKYRDTLDSNEQQKILDAESEYRRLVQNMTLGDERYRAMLTETAEQYYRTNETALAYINGQMGQVYTLNYNKQGTDIENKANALPMLNQVATGEEFTEGLVKGYSFSLVDQATVDNLIKNGGSSPLLPAPSKRTLKEILQKSMDEGRDVTWNKKLMNSQLLQGILQGESMGKIADRIQNVTQSNMASAVRNARTMYTCAENKGRQDAMQKAEEDGVVMRKEWLAANDDRTRESHAELDGVQVSVNDKFPNGCMFPGDPAGLPREVYNCRCTMTTEVIGFNNGKQLLEYEENKLDKFDESNIINSTHIWDRKDERELTDEEIIDALKNPMKITDFKYDKKGRPSVRYIGKYATVCVNPSTKIASTAWRTGKRTRKKYDKE